LSDSETSIIPEQKGFGTTKKRKNLKLIEHIADVVVKKLSKQNDTQSDDKSKSLFGNGEVDLTPKAPIIVSQSQPSTSKEKAYDYDILKNDENDIYG
jgi:hypothetical protein